MPHRFRHRRRPGLDRLGELASSQARNQPSVRDQRHLPEGERDDIAFIGQLYGERQNELAPLRKAYRVNVISQAFGRELSAVIRSHRIIVGPRYPSARLLERSNLRRARSRRVLPRPEIEGMREEGLLAGVHYAPLGDDPVQEVRYWLARPEQRARIARGSGIRARQFHLRRSRSGSLRGDRRRMSALIRRF